MDELKIAAAVICSAILSKSSDGQTDLKADPKDTAEGYWKIQTTTRTRKLSRYQKSLLGS